MGCPLLLLLKGRCEDKKGTFVLCCRSANKVGALLRVDRGNVGNRKRMHGLGGRPFFARFTGALKLKKSTSKELRGACPLFVIHVL